MRRTKSEINIIGEDALNAAVSETEPPKGAHENEEWRFYFMLDIERQFGTLCPECTRGDCVVG